MFSGKEQKYGGYSIPKEHTDFVSRKTFDNDYPRIEAIFDRDLLARRIKHLLEGMPPYPSDPNKSVMMAIKELKAECLADAKDANDPDADEKTIKDDSDVLYNIKVKSLHDRIGKEDQAKNSTFYKENVGVLVHDKPELVWPQPALLSMLSMSPTACGP
jgi:hypothetical protein